jgi:hypothetical protein
MHEAEAAAADGLAPPCASDARAWSKPGVKDCDPLPLASLDDTVLRTLTDIVPCAHARDTIAKDGERL